MLDFDIICFGEPEFEAFCRKGFSRVEFNSARMFFVCDQGNPLRIDLWCSFFLFKSRLVCLPSRLQLCKKEIAPLVFERNFFFEQGLSAFIGELNDWVPLEVFSSGTPVLTCGSF